MKLLERDSLQDRLHALLAQAAAGPGRLVFLGGEAGVGKTALLQHFLLGLPEGTAVAIGRCEPLSTPRPLLPLLDMAAALGPQVDECLAANDARGQLFAAVRTALEAPGAPQVVVIEDLHWADAATLDLVRYLARRLERMHALLIGSYRDDQIGATHPLRVLMGDVSTGTGSRRMAVPRLSRDAVARLAIDSPVDVDALYRRTAGNPFFVAEVLAADAADIPETVRDTVLARMARLPDPARGALEACAVLGTQVDPAMLTAVEPTTTEAMETCVTQGMLQWRGKDLHFRHALVSEAIRDALSPRRRTALHRAALAALAARQPDDASRLAHHAEHAGDDAAVLRYAPEAARQAARARSHREAVAQYERALRHAAALPDSDRARLLDALSREHYLVDRSEDSIATRRQAIDLWRRLGEEMAAGDSLRWLSRALWVSGRNDEAHEASHEAIALLQRHPPGHALAMAYSNEAQVQMLALELDQTIAWGTRAIELAERLGDTECMVHALNNVGSARIVEGDEQGRSDLERSLRIALKNGYEDHVARAYTNLGSCYCERYRFADALGYLEAGIGYCREHDLDYLGAYMQAYKARVLLHRGRWSEASELALRILHNPTAAPVNRIISAVALGRIRARRGDPDVWPVLDTALALARQTGDLQRLAPVCRARAEAAWLEGRRDRALAEARAEYPQALERGHPWFLGELAYWRWKAGDLEQPPPACAQPWALQIRGQALAAAAAWEALDCRYEAAWARLEAEDERALHGAHRIFAELGAEPARRQATRRLQDLGLQAPPRGPRASTRANPARLTACQLAVLERLAEGQSNAEIAASLHRSPRTVEHHVAAVLAKLAVHSRTEAMRVAIERGIVSPEGRHPK